LRSRPVQAHPQPALTQRVDEVERLRTAARRAVQHTLSAQTTGVVHLRDKLTAVGPAATLARGYAVVQRVTGPERHVVHAVADAPPGSQLRIRVADGAVSAAALGSQILTPTTKEAP
jgi:exodeoxyribonuclease VII large subunit